MAGEMMEEARQLRAENARLRAAAQKFVDLFVWEPSEESGEVVPHLDRTFPDFNVTLTELRNVLEQRAVQK